MARRHHLIFLVVLLVIAVLLLLYLNIPKEGGVKGIDIEEVTEGSAIMDFFGEQYNDKEISTAFRYSGFYHGNYFEDAFLDEKGRVLMRVGKDMKPYDGIIEGFILEKIKDNKPIVYVFLDEDWRKKIGTTYIWYGMNFENNGVFTYKEISKGIYMDSFEDAPERFMEDYTIHLGGIIVGDVSKEKIENGNEDITLMKFV